MNLSAVGLIVTLVLGILAAPLASNAQQEMPRIGFLAAGRGHASPTYLHEAFR
jgi:hypothetical protein